MRVTRRAVGKTLLATAAGSLAGAGLAARMAAAADATEERIRTQVCVIGGGSGGIGAALAAARAGAEVVLVEREAVLGGTSTNAWVHTWEPVSGADGIPRDLYQMMAEDPLAVVEQEYAAGAPRRGGKPLPFEPRALIYCARRALESGGKCRVLLGTTFYRARVEGERITAVEAWFSGRRLLIEADVFLDCTADGDLCVDAGCEFHLGEDPKSLYGEPSAPEHAGVHLNGITLVYRVTNTGVKHKPYLPRGIQEGLCPRPVCIRAMPNGDLLLNAVNMLDGNALLADDYSRLMQEGYDRVLEHFHWLQTLPPESSPWNRPAGPEGFATWTIVGVAPRLGVRETRRIVGDYVLTEHDCQAGLRGQQHADIIAISDHAVDIHGKKSRLYEVPNGPYGIPYRCLLPRGVRNLLIASRAASFSHVAASSCRLCRTVMTLGQAAGNAAAMAARERLAPRQIDVRKLQGLLGEQGVAITA